MPRLAFGLVLIGVAVALLGEGGPEDASAARSYRVAVYDGGESFRWMEGANTWVERWPQPRVLLALRRSWSQQVT